MMGLLTRPSIQKTQVAMMIGIVGVWCGYLLMALTTERHRFVERVLQSSWWLGPTLFLLLAVLGIPESTALGISKRPPSGWVRLAWAAVIVAATLAGFFLAKSFRPTSSNGWGLGGSAPHWWQERPNFDECYWVFWVDSLPLLYLVVVVCCCVTVKHQPSRFTRCAVRYLNSLWLESLGGVLVGGHTHCTVPGDPRWRRLLEAGRDVVMFIHLANEVWLGVLAVRRVRAFKMTMDSMVGVKGQSKNATSPSLQIITGLFILAWACQGSRVLSHSVEAYRFHQAVLDTVAACCLVILLVMIAQVFHTPLALLHSEVRKAEMSGDNNILANEARWSEQTLRSARNAIMVTLINWLLVLCIVIAFGFLPRLQGTMPGFIAYIVMWDLRTCIDATCMTRLCMFSGLTCCRGSRSARPQSTRPDLALAPQPHPASGNPLWSAKVEELAGRGFYLGHLLDFLEGLHWRQVMPSFDPDRSTTNDVVRGAIIKLSRDPHPHTGGKALASIWNHGQPVWPECMVTHSWSSLFLHLVAAVVADALKVDVYYDWVFEELRTIDGLRNIRQQLCAKNTLETTYWVCAFSVNQHASICASFGQPPRHQSDMKEWKRKRTDWTGELHHSCNCTEPKLFDSNPVPCEMNKFNDMIELLSQRISGFKQVIAVDSEFSLLQRCWCIAEIARASQLGMSQNTMILCPDAIDRNHRELSTLDVGACKSSSSADKQRILSEIPDKDAFNAWLQWLMLSKEGIFMQQTLCPCDRLVSASRIAARIYRLNEGKVLRYCGDCIDDLEQMVHTLSDNTSSSMSNTAPTSTVEPCETV